MATSVFTKASSTLVSPLVSTVTVLGAHLVLKCLGFERLYALTARVPTVSRAATPDLVRAESMSVSVERACRRICRRAYCVQRATALAALLRLRGYPAVVVIGVRRPPFEAHAWAEVDSVPVGEQMETIATYHVIRRAWPAEAWGSPARARRGQSLSTL